MTRSRAARAGASRAARAPGARFARRNERKVRSRTRVLDAARDLAEQRGITRLTLDEIARRANLSKGAVLFHFGSKNALLAELLREDAASVAGDIVAHCEIAAARASPRYFERITRRLRRELRGTGVAEALRQAIAGTERERSAWRPVRQALLGKLRTLAGHCGLGSNATLAAWLVLVSIAFSEEIPPLRRLVITSALGPGGPIRQP